MNLYVETNFILEQSYLQEQQEACEQILSLAEEQRISLRLPAVCIGEAYGALIGRSKKRTQLHLNLFQELKELARSKPYNDVRDQFQDLTRLLLSIGEEEKRRLDSALHHVLKVTTLIPIDTVIVRRSVELQTSRDLQPADSLVYSSVLADLSGQPQTIPNYFVTKNSKDFSNPDIVADLAQLNCNLVTRFGEAYGLLLSDARRIPDA